MKTEKRRWIGLLAGVLLLALTACSGGTGTASVFTSQEDAQALMQEVDDQLLYDTDLQAEARSIAEWLAAEPSRLRASGTSLVRTEPLTADGNMGYLNDLNNFLYWSGCYGSVRMDTQIALELESSTAGSARLLVPQREGAELVLQPYAAGCTRMGAAFVQYSGMTYVVAVFQ